ncbi:spermatogenesis-associated serine-rich protein 2-like isoform X2 [Mizuhopecten yessoensis]|uniref:spermatogenesis-associated serine-rich protein 2-like isoform X2 n=1 Tax=Mizuhopecten yessoensis TaxID=6573 RepID=UPI000B45C01B|nr:spermatogenesis-associated serine-rich protein 2-like isoform X2 [Mizuhopecten yessoensis]XP_021364330.1 spermatogenesis-associated serine-rich protein 2-like isoform X2 [Mizuhopecten yessoensis]
MTTDNSGVILFDSRTKAVMAEVPQSQENIKEKVNAVREVVLGKSNNEIILVLQYYDYNVEKAIQAYLEDGAKSALTEWRFSGPKVANKKKKNKKKLGKTGNGDDMSPTQNGDVSDHIGEALANGVLENGTCAIKLGIEAETTGGGGGEHITGPDLPASASTVNGAVPSTVPSHDQGAGASEVTPQSHDQGAESSQASQSLPQRQPHQNHHKQRLHSGSHSSSNRQRSASERSTSSNPSSDSRPVKRKVHGGMEKSMKDLHRQTVSLERLRLVMNEEVEKNFKRIKSVFEEVRTCLNKREADLLVEMEKVKAVANNTFASRQKTGADLKVMVDRSETMSEEELAKLRTDIKHFIGDRKIDEELSRTTRFLYDSDFLKLEVGRFGEVVPAKTAYSSHPAYVVVNKPTVEPARVEPPRVEPVEPHPVVNQVSKDEETLTSEQAHDMAELQKRLKGSLKLQGLDSTNTNESSRPATAPASEQPSQSGQASSTRGAYDQRRGRRQRPRRDGPRGGYSGEGGSRGGYDGPRGGYGGDGGSRGGYNNDGGSREGYNNDGGFRGGYNRDGGRRQNEYYNSSKTPQGPDNTVHIGRQSQSGGRGSRGSPRGRGSGRPRSPRKDGPGGPRNSPGSQGDGAQRGSNRPESSTKSPTQNKLESAVV